MQANRDCITAVMVSHERWDALYNSFDEPFDYDEGARRTSEMCGVERDLLTTPAVNLNDVIAKLEVSLKGENVDLAVSALADLKRLDADLPTRTSEDLLLFSAAA